MAIVNAHENVCSKDFISKTYNNTVSYEHPADVQRQHKETRVESIQRNNVLGEVKRFFLTVTSHCSPSHP